MCHRRLRRTASKLTTADLREIALLIARPRYGSSDRVRDKARARLKRLELISFDRRTREWNVSPAGRLALSESKEAGTND